MLDLTSRISAAPIARGGPRFLAVFGSGLLLIWGVVALAAGSVADSLGGSGAVGDVIALVLWIAAIFSMYAAFSEWHRGQLGCAAVSLLTLVIAVLLAPGWLIFWAFSGGLIGLSAFLSRPAGSVPRAEVRMRVAPCPVGVRPATPRVLRALPVLAVIALAGCGGSGGSSPSRSQIAAAVVHAAPGVSVEPQPTSWESISVVGLRLTKVKETRGSVDATGVATLHVSEDPTFSQTTSGAPTPQQQVLLPPAGTDVVSPVDVHATVAHAKERLAVSAETVSLVQPAVSASADPALAAAAARSITAVFRYSGSASAYDAAQRPLYVTTKTGPPGPDGFSPWWPPTLTKGGNGPSFGDHGSLLDLLSIRCSAPGGGEIQNITLPSQMSASNVKLKVVKTLYPAPLTAEVDGTATVGIHGLKDSILGQSPSQTYPCRALRSSIKFAEVLIRQPSTGRWLVAELDAKAPGSTGVYSSLYLTGFGPSYALRGL